MCGDTSDVPACYSTVQYEDYEQYDASKQHEGLNEYILKTQIVPPVCPTCPSFHGKPLEEDEEEEDDDIVGVEEETNKKMKRKTEKKKMKRNTGKKKKMMEMGILRRIK